MKLEEGSDQFRELCEKWDKMLDDDNVAWHEFAGEVMGHEHDYGTVCHAIAYGMKKAFKVLNKHPQGGVTGLQASFLAWTMLDFFGMRDPVGTRILGYSELCFPRGEEHFTTIPHDVWERVKEFAEQQLKDHSAEMIGSVRSHMIDIVQGKVPFGLKVGAQAREVQGGQG